MSTSDTISKANLLRPAEDYNKLRREGIVHIEKLAGNVWTDFNTHDPGITLLEALCYAITDLAYRTRFDMKDLLSQNTFDHNVWKNIFYTAREILPCNPVTINDYRKLVMDVDGVRNAWITISKDCEVPMYLNEAAIVDAFSDDDLIAKIKLQQPCDCGDKVKFPYTTEANTDGQRISIKGLVFYDEVPAASTDQYKIVELNGLYKIILEYEEEIIEKKKEDEVRKQVLKVLHRHRNVCEDYLSVTGAEYKDFFMQASVSLSENADADQVLAEMCYLVQNYFTPVIKFYSLDEMTQKEMPADEIFEGPVLKHGFILDDELEKTDLFRDMRLSDIINFISDIDGINSLRIFKILEEPDAENAPASTDSCSSEAYFDQWIEKIKDQKLVGRLSIDDMMKFFHPSEEDLYTPVSAIHFYKPSGEVFINTDRFLKLLNDLKGKDKYLKMHGFTNNFPVPSGEDMQLNNFYPVQYELPFTYRVGESGLPLRDGRIRLIQSLQLKGYLAVFEQLFLNYMYQVSDMNEIFSFNDIKFKGKTNHKPVKSECTDNKNPLPAQTGKFKEPVPNQIIYKDEQNKIVEKIIGYKCLYYDAEKYIAELQSIIEPESEFESHRNTMLDHLLARFNEDMSEYVSLMKYIYPDDYLIRVIKNKTDLLADYPAISNNRARAYNYKLEEEGVDYENKTWDEDEIALNISGLEKRIARLIGLADYRRKDLAPDNLFVEKFTDPADGKEKIKIILYEDETKGKYLLATEALSANCADEIMHTFIESGCSGNNFKKYPEQRAPHHRAHHHKHHDELSFALLDEDGKELAFSPIYNTHQLRDDAMQLAKCYLEQICHGEGFHLIEHILLRPKGDTQLTDENNQPSGAEFQLLDICLDKCDITIKQDATERLKYKFDLQVLPPEKCLDGKRWNVILNRIDPPNMDGSFIKILEHQFKDYELASDFISKVREYGSELINFSVYKTNSIANPKYYFKLKDENSITLVESSCFSVFSKTPSIDDKAVPGSRTDCTDIVVNGIVEEIEDLKKISCIRI